MSDFKDWKQKKHAKDWLLYPENIGVRLSIDETAFTNGDLYTILTNKSAKGRTEHLIKKGVKKPAILSTPPHITVGKDRKKGFLNALKKYNIPANNDFILHINEKKRYSPTNCQTF